MCGNWSITDGRPSDSATRYLNFDRGCACGPVSFSRLLRFRRHRRGARSLTLDKPECKGGRCSQSPCPRQRLRCRIMRNDAGLNPARVIPRYIYIFLGCAVVSSGEGCSGSHGGRVAQHPEHLKGSRCVQEQSQSVRHFLLRNARRGRRCEPLRPAG